MITYIGSCSSSTNNAHKDNNTITFDNLTQGTTYGNCSIKVTDNATNVSNLLMISLFTIDNNSDNTSLGIPMVVSVSSTSSDGTYRSSDAFCYSDPNNSNWFFDHYSSCRK